MLAIGGGSAIDAAKVIAAKVTSKKPVARLTGILKLKAPTLPLYAAPTTAGTGSEVTLVAVLSDREARIKRPVVDPKLVPTAAALDPRLTVGLPPAVTAASGMDAMTHAVESYLSRHATQDTDRLALAAVRMIARHLPRCFADGNDLEARQALLIAASYAGSAFTRANVGYVHAIAHQFGARFHTPHGLANAIVMPYVLEYTRPAVERRMADLARAAGIEGEPDAVLADRFIQHIRDLNAELGIPGYLQDLTPSDVPRIAKAALKEAHSLYPVPRYMDHRCCEEIVARMLPPSVTDS
ncbi:MAG: iron-containing alcohol dehydrogenase [Candidatus Wenzhouxiangella sp. M2_3B_020]